MSCTLTLDDVNGITIVRDNSLPTLTYTSEYGSFTRLGNALLYASQFVAGRTLAFEQYLDLQPVVTLGQPSRAEVGGGVCTVTIDDVAGISITRDMNLPALNYAADANGFRHVARAFLFAALDPNISISRQFESALAR